MRLAAVGLEVHLRQGGALFRQEAEIDKKLREQRQILARRELTGSEVEVRTPPVPLLPRLFDRHLPGGRDVLRPHRLELVERKNYDTGVVRGEYLLDRCTQARRAAGWAARPFAPCSARWCWR